LVAWNIADTFSCEAVDDDYVIAIDAIDGEICPGSICGVGGLMATIVADNGETLHTNAQQWKCWNAEGNRDSAPPGNWMAIDFDDSSWCAWPSCRQPPLRVPFELKPVVHRPNAVSYGRNDYDDTHWAAYIPRAVGYPDTAGHVKPGIADAAEWIWTADSEIHNDVYCRGRLKTEDLIGGAATGPVGCHTLDCANRPATCAVTVDCTGWCVACFLILSATA
jgi:hypothetical protein